MFRNMKIAIAGSGLAVALLTGANASAADATKGVFAALSDTAPRSVFDQISESAPRSPFDALNESAPRSPFDEIRDSAPRSGGAFGGLADSAP